MGRNLGFFPSQLLFLFAPFLYVAEHFLRAGLFASCGGPVEQLHCARQAS